MRGTTEPVQSDASAASHGLAARARRLMLVAAGLVAVSGTLVTASAAGGAARAARTERGPCAVLTPPIAATLLGVHARPSAAVGAIAGLVECAYEGSRARRGDSATLREESYSFFKTFAFTTARGAVVGSVGEPGTPASGISRVRDVGIFAVLSFSTARTSPAGPQILGWVEDGRAYVLTVYSKVPTAATMIGAAREMSVLASR